jgi:hypothetical protein
MVVIFSRFLLWAGLKVLSDFCRGCEICEKCPSGILCAMYKEEERGRAIKAVLDCERKGGTEIKGI